MKVITSVTVRTARIEKKGDKDVRKVVSLRPGEHELDDAFAKTLIARGQAVAVAEAVKAAASAPAGPSVTKVAEPAKPAPAAKGKAKK